MRVIRCNCVWTTARTASDFAAQQRISVISFNALIATVSSGGVGASQALTGAWIAVRCVPIAFASLAIREVPETRLALITFTTVRIRVAFALAGDDVAFIVGRSNAVTVACLATFWAETVCAGHTFVALTTKNVRLALAIAAEFFTLFAHRSGWVAVAQFGAIEHVNADRVEDFITFGRCSLFVVNVVVHTIAIVGNVFAATIFGWWRSGQNDGVFDARQN